MKSGSVNQRQTPPVVLVISANDPSSGADYLAFGSFYHSRTRPSAPVANIGLLQQARVLDLPLVAIGGVDASNGAELIGAGADMLAVISAVFDAEDSFQAASNLSRLFERNSAVAG